VLRLLDARTGSYAEVSPARPGLLRVCVYVPAASGGSGITALRVLLVADLLARVAELGNLQVLTVLVSDGEFPGQVSAAERAAEALGIHPPAARASSGAAQALLGGPIDVYVTGHGATADDDRQSGLVTCVGDAHLRGTGDPGEATGDLLAGQEHDPLAVRLALMSFPTHRPAHLTDSVLASARETAGDWRRRVAQWAERPSKPIPAHLAETAQAAFGDLDTASAIALLRGLAHDDSVPAGARFETFLYVDRILGLDLPRDIGKPG
jgi:hypothetical protein